MALLASPADSTLADSAGSPRVVRVLEAFEVRAPLLHDPFSSETAHLMRRESFAALPVDGLVGVVMSRSGVVGRGDELHVRGGRTGDLQMTLMGVTLNDPFRDRPMDVPLPGLESARLLSGGIDADHGGSVAGVLEVETLELREEPRREIRWETDGALGTRFDRATTLVMTGLGSTGLGASLAAEATFDDTALPALRSQGRREALGVPLGWRADNRLLGHAKVGTVGARSTHWSLDVLGSRRLQQPFDPMWSLDGYTSPGALPTGPRFSPDTGPGLTRYRAADHATMTDERRLAAVLAATRTSRFARTRVSLGWVASRRLVSVGGTDDETYLGVANVPLFGLADSPTSDPFLVYQGDEPFFQRRSAQTLTLRSDHERTSRGGSSRVRLGAGGTYLGVRLREVDASTRGLGVDFVRGYEAYAPGAFAYGQSRWAFEGMVLNAGLRAEWFTAGPQAERQSLGEPARGIRSFSPRLGIAYPISVNDVFSLSYVRIQQNPARDFLYENRRAITNRQPLGNPQLEPTTAIAYQAAIKHLVNERWSMQGAIFFTDLFGQVGARFEDVGSGVPRLRYQNADEGHASGFEWSVLHDAARGARLELHYTYMIARGTQSLEEGVPYGARLGVRPGPIGEHPLDWDRRHSIAMTAQRPASEASQWSWGWSTALGSGLPWTPRERRIADADLSLVNSRRFGWDESTAASLRWWPRRFARGWSLGVDVRNLFDHRSESAATVDGYPHSEINTAYDDYGAYRNETGHSGGAYWDDGNGDGLPGWVAVHDPRLFQPPRAVRMSVSKRW